MRLPRMTTRRWMLVVAFVAALCGGTLRARALQRRAAFHSREKQSCLRQAQAAEREYRWMKEEGDTWCGPRVLLIRIAEDYGAAPELRERAAYHADLEVLYRRAAHCPWMLVPAETFFRPNERIGSLAGPRSKAEAYRSPQIARRQLAEHDECLRTREDIRIAEEHARMALDYDRRSGVLGKPGR
jgi:hypothetical protein